jgi:hypothetical protein
MPELENRRGSGCQGHQEQDSLFQPEYDGGLCARFGIFSPNFGRLNVC